MELLTPMLLALLMGYFLGSIPFGLILTKIFKAGDLRSIGSGNIGATNVLRTGRKELAAATLLLDLLKGTAAVLLAAQYLPGGEAFAAGGAFIGHLYPVWLRFSGGKGVATYAGILLGLLWQAGLVYAAVWLLSLLIFRISSLAGLLAAMAAPFTVYYFGRGDIALMMMGCSMLVGWKHRDNIMRLIAGNEPRIGSKPS